MNAGVWAAIVTGVGAIVISVISAMQAERSQKEKTQTDRLTLAQAETDRIILNLRQENTLLWEQMNALRSENDTLRKRIRVLEGE